MLWLAIVCLLPLSGAQADTYTWQVASTTTGDWFTAGNWIPAQAPTNNGDTVIITNGYVLLTNATAALASFSITNATLIFSNWNTYLTASNVTILSKGVMTLPPAFTDVQMSNNIYVVCSNFMLNAGGTILADERGYARTNGPGRGANAGGNYTGGGGGYGGKGGSGTGGNAGGQPYGSTNAPLDPGSGGGENPGTRTGGHGGGAVRIEAAGDMTIDGTVTANGVTGGSYVGGGSGGAIYMTCASFGGSTNGILRANGGNGSGGGGGGGRIAVNYTSLNGTPGVRFSVNRGTGIYMVDDNAPVDCPAPQMGTLSFTNSALLDSVLNAWGGTGSGLNGYFIFQSTNVWAPTNLLVLSNSTLGILEGSSLQITNDLTVVTGGVVVAAHATLACGGNLTLTNGARLIVYGGETNTTYTNYGTWVGVTNTLTVASNCWIYPFSHSTNGGSVLLQVGGMAIRSGGGIDADGRGYAMMNGPGRGADASGNYTAGGGGYGGKGGSGTGGAGGQPYGSTNAPLDPGSGGGARDGYALTSGHGGGAVRIEAAGDMTIDGTVTANGVAPGTYIGSGSGGAIYMTCASFGGNANGILQANGGGAAGSGGGGGGRIAVWYGVPENRWEGIRNGTDMRRVSIITNASDYSEFLGMVSVTNGTGWTNLPPVGAECGTIVFLTVTPPCGTMFMCQ